MNEISDFNRDLEYQDNLLKSKQNDKHRFKQNDKVYQYYSNLHQQK